MEQAGSGTPTRRQWQRWAPRVLGVLSLLALILGVTLLDPSPAITPLTLWTAPLKPLLNALPFVLLAVVLATLTRRMVLSCWLAWLLAALLYGVNELKIANLATPLMPADFRMLGQLEGGGGHLLSGYLPHSALMWVALAAVIVVTALLIWREPPELLRRWWVRATSGAVALVLLVSMVLAVPAWSSVYRADLGLQPWSARNTARATGLVSMLNLFHLRYSSAQPKPDVERARELIAQFRPQLESDLARGSATNLPDIIIVQSESFIDPGILKGYDDDAFIPELARLRKTGEHGRMHVPTFGGGTIRTEFEMLTGISLRYYPAVQFPYLQFNQRTIPSLVRTLESHGYTTTAIHPNRPEFWNRTAAFKALGFQHFISIHDFPADVHKDGRYVSDKDFTDEILRQLKDTGPPQFLFAISIEAHGPYDYDEGIDTAERDAIPVPDVVANPWRTQLQNYLYHIRHADQQLGRLADVLAKRERPTLLMFYGDHLPALVPAFQAMGFDNGEGFFMQTVPWLLVEPNRPGPDRTMPHLAAWTAPGLLLERAGIHDAAWFNLTDAAGPKLAHLSRAPDAPKPEPGPDSELDKDMANATWLHMRGKLAPWLPSTPDGSARLAKDLPRSHPAAANP